MSSAASSGETESLRSRVTAALIYPALLTFMSVALVSLLMFYILPQFSGFLDQCSDRVGSVLVTGCGFERARIFIIDRQ